MVKKWKDNNDVTKASFKKRKKKESFKKSCDNRKLIKAHIKEFKEKLIFISQAETERKKRQKK